jgi:signal transduction histidine kinase/CheY-like chemotaxis protein
LIDLDLHAIEGELFEKLNRELYQTDLPRIEARYAALSEAERARPEVAVCFVIAFMRLGLFERAHAVGRGLLFEGNTHHLSFDQCRRLATSLGAHLEGRERAPTSAAGRALLERYAGVPTATLHLNWYVFAWYEYVSALNLALVLTLRALEQGDARSLGRCLSYLGLSCGLVGLYDLSTSFSEAGRRITDEQVTEPFGPYWASEAAAIDATTQFYAGHWTAASEAGLRVTGGEPGPAAFPFSHVYTNTILMRAGLDGFHFDTFGRAVSQLQALLGRQFDSRYSVQSHYCSAIFLLLQGREQDAMRHLAVARAANAKDENRFRSINHSHCLAYEARIYFLMGYFDEAIDLCRQAIRTLPAGSTDGRHALEISSLLWRVLILTRSPLLDLEPAKAKERAALEAEVAAEVKARVRFGVAARRRHRVYAGLARRIARMDAGALVRYMTENKGICASEHADVLTLVARAATGSLRPYATLESIADSAKSINYVEMVSAWTRSLQQLGELDQDAVLQKMLSLGELTAKMTGAQEVRIAEEEGGGRAQELRRFAAGIALIRDGAAQSLRLSLSTDRFAMKVDVRAPTLDLAYDRHVLDAIALAQSSLEGHIRLLELADARESEALLASVAKTTAMLAHDVRAPFSTLRSVLDLLRGGRRDDAFLQEATDIVGKKLLAVDDLIRDVLEATRPAAVSAQPVDYASFLLETLEICFKDHGTTKDHDFAYELRATRDPLLDAGRFRRVVSNVVLNAAQMAEAGSRINFSSDDGGDHVLLRIHNTGTQLREEDVAHLFKSFFSRRRGGTGLGLAIAHKVVAAHGGRIWAANEAGGVAFYIELPAAKTPSPTPRAPVQLPQRIADLRLTPGRKTAKATGDAQGEAATAEAICLMVVDDDSVYRALIGDLVRSSRLEQKVRVYEAASYGEAMLLLTDRPGISHLICDVDLGGDKDGVDLVAAALAARADRRCMVHSNRLPELIAARLAGLPVWGIVGKPMTAKALMRFVQGEPLASPPPDAVALVAPAGERPPAEEH